MKHFISAIFLQIKPLAARQRSQYLSHASAKSDDGIDLLKHFTDDTRRVCAFVPCVLLHLNGGPDGASRDAPVSVRPVRSTSSGSTANEIDLSSGGNNLLLTGGCLMATTPIQTDLSSEKPVKTQRRYTVGYLPGRGDASTPSLHLSGKWLKDAGFETGTGVTVKIAGDCIVLIPDNDEIHELRKQLQQIKQAFIGLKGEVEG
ncbi:type I addiction module toxin, SymE family [Klebsiella pneumoniae]|uniref:Type I addiction module toxin, SymE family n=1 Tax=Klebsiella pneumoniae TaxID=573 RepID=A0A927E027_KLEPN|nr:type I addiction module toxin, SymE family [Klebsiella pneumoniae]